MTEAAHAAAEEAAASGPEVAAGASGLRVCLLSMEADPYSTVWGTYPRELALGLAQLGHAPTLVTAGEAFADFDLESRGVRVVRLDLGELAVPRGQAVPFSWRLLRNRTSRRLWWRSSQGVCVRAEAFGSLAADWVRENRKDFDLVHDNQTLDASLLGLARYLPVLATLHYPVAQDLSAEVEIEGEGPAAEAARSWYRPWIETQSEVSARLARILCPSEASWALVRERLQVPPERLGICRAGVDREAFRPIVQVQRDPDRFICALGEGRVALRACTDLLRAVEILHGRHPRVRLTLAVHPSCEETARQCIGQSHALAECVECYAGVGLEDLAELYSEAAMGVAPESKDDAGIRVLEALSMNLPLAVTGKAAEEVAGEAGLAAPVRDPEALAAAMERLLVDEELRLRLRLNAKDRADGFGDWVDVAFRHEREYRTLLS